MFRFSASGCAVVALALTAPDLSAQDHSLGVNLRVVGTTQVGVTWLASPSFAVRPALSGSWQKTTNPFGGSNEISQWAFDVDFLFGAPTRDRVTVYYGIGGSVGGAKGGTAPASTIWRGRALVGARVNALDRVAFYGEVGVEYQDAGDVLGQRVALATFPLGVVVYLK
jgi:hypothetical protein